MFSRHLKALRLLVNPLDSMLQFQAESDVTELQMGGVRAFLVHSPEIAQEIFRDRVEGYPKGGGLQEGLSDILGENTTIKEGEDWRKYRKKVMRALGSRVFDVLAPAIGSSIVGAVDEIGRRKVLDVSRLGVELTTQAVVVALFGRELGERELGRVCDDMSGIMKGLTLATIHHALPRLLQRVPLRGLDDFDSAIDGLRSQVRSLLLECEDAGEHFMANVLREEYRDDPPKALEDELVGLMIGGFDTTANGLASSLHLLAANPDVQDSMREELASILGERPPSSDDVGRLKVAEIVMKEALRLYPPAWVLVRMAKESHVLAGCQVPKGSAVVTVVYSIQRHPGYWVDPARFNPERFRESGNGRHRCAWMPFGFGPRICSGMRLGLFEASLALSRIVQRYRLRPVEGGTMELRASTTLRPKKPLLVGFERI